MDVIEAVESSNKVANGDKHYSLARIARLDYKDAPTLKASNKFSDIVARLQRAIESVDIYLAILARRRSGAVSHLRLQEPKILSFQTAS